MDDPYPFPNEFAPVGSSIFYAIRFAPVQAHPELALVNALYRSIKRIPLQCSEPGIAKEKLNWWREELMRADRNQAHHPIARGISRIQSRHSLAGDHFEPLLSVVGQEIEKIPIDQWKDLESHCRRTGGDFAQLLTRISGGDGVQLQVATELGCLTRIVEIVRDLGRDLRDGQCFIPMEELANNAIPLSEILQQSWKPQVTGLLHSLSQNLHQRYRKIVTDLPADRSALGPVLSLAAMADTLLHEIAKDGYRVLEHRTSLTPLRKLWICWRCQRKKRGPSHV